MNQNHDQETPRHRETVILSIISTGTILLIGMFGLIEIVGNVMVDDSASSVLKNSARIIDSAVATSSAFAVFIYYAIVTEGIGAIRRAASLGRERDNSVVQFLVAIRLFHFLDFLIVVVAGLAIAKRTIFG